MKPCRNTKCYYFNGAAISQCHKGFPIDSASCHKYEQSPQAGSETGSAELDLLRKKILELERDVQKWYEAYRECCDMN